jgi:hypothetical protein
LTRSSPAASSCLECFLSDDPKLGLPFLVWRREQRGRVLILLVALLVLAAARDRLLKIVHRQANAVELAQQGGGAPAHLTSPMTTIMVMREFQMKPLEA